MGADRNHDGIVTEAEFAAAFGANQVSRPVVTTAVARPVTTAIAPPITTAIAEPTITTATAPAALRTQVIQRAPDLFDLADRNHDGVVSQSEFASMFGQGSTARTSAAVPRGSGPIISEPIVGAPPPPPPITEPIAW